MIMAREAYKVGDNLAYTKFSDKDKESKNHTLCEAKQNQLEDMINSL